MELHSGVFNVTFVADYVVNIVCDLLQCFHAELINMSATKRFRPAPTVQQIQTDVLTKVCTHRCFKS